MDLLIPIFSAPMGKENVFIYVDLRKDYVSYGFKLKPQNYYKRFEKFKKQPEYFFSEWEIFNWDLFADKNLGPCIFRFMSDETALDFMKQYFLNFALPKKQKNIVFRTKQRLSLRVLFHQKH